jgi:multicomponent Na+:H+ antiporter subunit D
MIMGLGLFTTLALAGTILHIVHNIFAKTNLFLVSGVVYRLRGTYDLPSLGGIYRVFPFLSVLFLISAFSLAGMPPLSGFWSKLLLIKAGLESEAYTLVVVALIVSLLTLFSMTKIWNQVFWKKPPKAAAHRPLSWPLFLTPLVILAAMILSFMLVAEPLVILVTSAARQLMNPADYIQSVLGETP